MSFLGFLPGFGLEGITHSLDAFWAVVLVACNMERMGVPVAQRVVEVIFAGDGIVADAMRRGRTEMGERNGWWEKTKWRDKSRVLV
jgi:hypothetical protein